MLLKGEKFSRSLNEQESAINKATPPFSHTIDNDTAADRLNGEQKARKEGPDNEPSPLCP